MFPLWTKSESSRQHSLRCSLAVLTGHLHARQPLGQFAS